MVDLGRSSADAAARREIVQRCRRRRSGPSISPGDPLLRAHLLRLAEDEHVLLLTMHHIVSDGWSMGVLWRSWSVSTTLFARASLGRCRSCRSSTPTMPSGSGSGCRARCWNNSSRTGGSNWTGVERAGAADRSAASGGAELPRRAASVRAAAETGRVAARR